MGEWVERREGRGSPRRSDLRVQLLAEIPEMSARLCLRTFQRGPSSHKARHACNGINVYRREQSLIPNLWD